MNIVQKLIENKITIAVAESCTGGMLAKAITDESGSSQIFEIGIVAYSETAKSNLLGIDAVDIKKFGVVSETVAKQMARKVREIAKSQIGVGITGVAGPGGGTEGTPVGTVYIAIATQLRMVCRKHIFSGNRDSVRRQAVITTLLMIENFC